MDFPSLRFPPLNVITPFHPESLGLHLQASGSTISLLNTASAVVSAANDAQYYPFMVYEPSTARKMSYIVGATASGNVDVGIYDAQKNRLVNSGSVAQGTINTLQEIDITDTLLLPGLYFMAITFSSATATTFNVAPADEVLHVCTPMLDQAVGSFGLPAPANWVISVNTALRIHAMGVHFDTLV